MAKSIDLSGLKRQPVARPAAPTVELAVKTIHEQEEKAAVEVVPKEKIVRITVDLPEDVHTTLKLHSVRNRTTIRQLVIDLLLREFQ
jgi:mannose-1-phosphate guanylyltransferase